MILAIAVLMIHPQMAAPLSFSAEKVALVQPANTETSGTTTVSENSLPATSATLAAPDQPAAEPNAVALPEAPVPAPAVNSPAPLAYLKKGKPATVSIENCARKIVRTRFSGAGWPLCRTARQRLTPGPRGGPSPGTGAQELNPMLRPFAGNASLYAAIQVAPLLMDYAGKKDDVQPDWSSAPRVVGSAERQLRQLHLLRRAQRGLPLNRARRTLRKVSSL